MTVAQNRRLKGCIHERPASGIGLEPPTIDSYGDQHFRRLATLHVAKKKKFSTQATDEVQFFHADHNLSNQRRRDEQIGTVRVRSGIDGTMNWK